MYLFYKTVYDFQLLSILAKSFIIDIRLGSEYVSGDGYEQQLYYTLPNILTILQTRFAFYTTTIIFEIVTDVAFWEILLVVPVSLSSVVSENAGNDLNNATNADTSGKESCGKSIKRFTIQEASQKTFFYLLIFLF